MMITPKSSRFKQWLLACVLSARVFQGCASAAPEFQSDGMIMAGDYRLALGADSVVHLTDPEGLVYDLFFPMNYPAGVSKEAKIVKLKDPKRVVDEQNKSVKLTGQAAPPNGTAFSVIYSMTLTPAGKVRISVKAELAEPVGKYLGLRGDLHVSREAVAGGEIAIGDQKFLIKKAPPGENLSLKQGPAETVALNAGNPRKQITFIPVSQEGFSVVDHNTVSYRSPFLAMTFSMKGNELVYDIELPDASAAPKSVDTYAGVDFWETGRLHMPQYNQSRNLVQNPGFEAGFAYWHWASLGRFPAADKKYDDYSEISSEKPHTGKRVLALRGEAGQSPAEVATFAIPVEKGQDYTLSFYARGNNARQRLSLNAQGYFTPPFMIWKTIEVAGPEWTRYTFTFMTTHAVLNVSFGNPGQPKEDDWVYVDSVQLEKGSQATEFTTKPVTAWVASDYRGNLWEPGSDPHAALHLRGAPGSTGKVQVNEVDFFGKETKHGSLDYQLDSSGDVSLPLPWASQLPLGTHVINLVVATKDGFVGKDTSRLTVMRFLRNQHRNKNLFSAHLSNVSGSWNRYAEFFKRVGLGSTILFDPQSHAFHKTLEDNGILHFSSILDSGQGFKKEMGWVQQDGFDLSPEQLIQIEELCYQKAKAYPEIKYWKLNNEPETGHFIDNIPNMNKMVDALIAARKGTLRGNPEAVLVGSDPANMYASSGVAFVNTQLDAIGDRKVYDIPAIHPYRERPEAPDRDADTKLFLNMVDRHGYHGDVWFTEGIYHQNYIVPQWSLNTHVACSTDHFRGGALSYDQGWGEKMAAAYAARSWLVSLKYGDRVKLDIDWGFFGNSSSDVDLTPAAISFATNTLGNILGNATFKADLALGYEVRCYVFQNEKNRPVAAIWYHNMDSDKGKVACPMLDVSSLAKAYLGLQYADFMGNLHALTDNVQLGPFPVFINGEQAETQAFLEKLSQASLVDDKGALFASISAQSPTQVVVQIDNSINKPFNGNARLLKGKEVVAEEKVTIPAKKSWTRIIDNPLRANAMTSTDLILELTPEGKSEAKTFALMQSTMTWPKRKAPITLTGNLQEWQSAFHVPIVNRAEFPPYGENQSKFKENPVTWKGADDLSATMYATWDEANIYLAFAVKDDVLHPNARPEGAWNGDSVQLYFDGWADGRKRREMGYGPDDQVFAIWPHLTEGVIRRDVTPERQLAFLDAGPVKDARLKVTRNAGVTLYELALPVKDLNPVQLKAGQKFGFAPLINDDDGDYRKRALTLTPAGTEPSNRPDLFPTVILVP